MSNVSDITEHESRLFLAKVISHGVDTDEISLERVEEMKQEVAEISHKLVTIKADDFSSNFEMKHHVRTGIEMILSTFCVTIFERCDRKRRSSLGW